MLFDGQPICKSCFFKLPSEVRAKVEKEKKASEKSKKADKKVPQKSLKMSQNEETESTVRLCSGFPFFDFSIFYFVFTQLHAFSAHNQQRRGESLARLLVLPLLRRRRRRRRPPLQQQRQHPRQQEVQQLLIPPARHLRISSVSSKRRKYVHSSNTLSL